MDKLKQMLDAHRNKDREFPTYDELVALTETAAPKDIPASAMTLRDYFAAKAMQAVTTNEIGAKGFTFEQRAIWSYQQADAMLAARGAA